ncbi:MAG: GntR family transcriptional regulator [Pseudomonadota bacterium]
MASAPASTPENANQTAPSQKGAAEETVYDRIQTDIGNGTFSSGTRLKVQELADRYGTSAIPVREALRQLQGEGLVIIAPNRGATVAGLNREMMSDIYEVLQLMEPYFVRAFANTCSEADLKRLEAINAVIAEIPVNDKAAFNRHDQAFHETIAGKHYNGRALKIWNNQRKMLNTLSLQLPVSKARHQAILTEHTALIAAFWDNDEERAVEVANRHVSAAGKHMYAQMGGRGTP